MVTSIVNLFNAYTKRPITNKITKCLDCPHVYSELEDDAQSNGWYCMEGDMEVTWDSIHPKCPLKLG